MSDILSQEEERSPTTATADIQAEDDGGTACEKLETPFVGESGSLEKRGRESLGADEEDNREAGPPNEGNEVKDRPERKGGASEVADKATAQRDNGQEKTADVQDGNRGEEESRKEDKNEENITAPDVGRQAEVKGQGVKGEEKGTEGKEKTEGNGVVEEVGKGLKEGAKRDKGNGVQKEKEKKEEGRLGKAKEDGKGRVKTKRKSGGNTGAGDPQSPSSAPPSLTRPRSSAQSLRGTTKRDIMAKFQKDAPETPVVHNFKVQKSSMGMGGAMGGSIKQKVLQWCRNKTRTYEGVNIENFSSSWCDGLAFCALVHRYFPDAFDYSTLTPHDRRRNFTLAFSTAESKADCCPLLEVDDMILMGDRPDPLCVFTYVQELCQHLSKIDKERREKKQEAGDAKGETKEELEARPSGGAEKEEHNAEGEAETEGCGGTEEAGAVRSAGGEDDGGKSGGRGAEGEEGEVKEEP